MRAPPRNPMGDPPPYAAAASSEAGTFSNRSARTPSNSVRIPIPEDPTQNPWSSAHPSLADEHSSLLGTNTTYQTMPQPSSPAKRSRFRKSRIVRILVVCVVNAALLYLISHFTRDELDPAERSRVRREWSKELQSHRVFVKHVEAARAEWALETRKHEKQRAAMVAERQTWQAEWEEQEQKLSELHRTIQQDRKNWETEKWEREREWQRRRAEYEKEMERKRLREEAERKRREEDEQRRAGMHWEDMLPSPKCLGYGTREYTAKLEGVPRGQDRLSVCRGTEAEFHGRKMRPQSCDDRGSGGLWAKWIVNFQEPTCTTWWSNLVDKGCTAQGSHIRRFEQHLENIMWGDDWKVMCTTAPTDFNNRHFDSPTSCAQWGKHGVFGYWDVRDDSC